MGSKRTREPKKSMPEYRAWADMWQRCTNEKNCSFKRYGARGISVCAEWETFETFLADMGRRPARGYSLERRDVNGNYAASNCRWATRIEQQQNLRTNRMLTANGETLCLAEWARRTGLGEDTLTSRVRKGWADERAINTPRRTNARAA